MEALYTAVATAIGGRDGHVRSSDGVLDLDTRTPGSMGGQGGAFTNPEQLFAAGISTCFNGAFNLAAMRKRIKTGTVEITASVGIGKNDSGGFQLAVNLEAYVPGVTKEVAEELVRDAEKICPYTNAIRGNVELTTAVRV